MPDENKMKALKLANFKVKRTCYRCVHFDEGGRGWGTCRKITYEHLKHTKTDEPRKASVPVDGWCPQHETWLEAEALLKGHREFVEKTGFEKCACGQPGVTIIQGAGTFCFECHQERLEGAS